MSYFCTLAGKFQRKEGPAGPSADAPFYLHNLCSQPNFIVLVLEKDNTANLESHTWVRFLLHGLTLLYYCTPTLLNRSYFYAQIYFLSAGLSPFVIVLVF